MPDHTPFLTAIASNPDDDLPRLVYADWLDEHGDPDRSEFIRLQCHTAHVGPLDPSWAPAKLREFDLFKANEAKWRSGDRSDHSYVLMDRWRRGFPESVCLADVADRRWEGGEWCNGVFEIAADAELDEWNPLRGPWPNVGPVSGLSFSGWDRGCGPLLRCERFRTTRRIELSEWEAGVRAETLNDFLDELADLPVGQLPELSTLNLDQGELTLAGLDALASTQTLQTITSLRLRFPMGVGSSADRRSWAEATSRLFAVVAPRLEHLSLQAFPPYLIELFGWLAWPRLRALEIRHVYEHGLSLYDFSNTPCLTTLSIIHQPGAGGGRFDPNPLQTFDDGWPEESLKVLALSSVPVEELRPWLAYPERFSLDFLSADVKGGRLQMEELASYPLTRGLKGLAGSFTNTDLTPLTDPTVLPELHTIWSEAPKPPPKLRWPGGMRAVIPTDEPRATHYGPSRSGWCGWGDLFG